MESTVIIIVGWVLLVSGAFGMLMAIANSMRHRFEPSMSDIAAGVGSGLVLLASAVAMFLNTKL